MRKVIKGLAILPLRVLESIALGYCFVIEKLKKGSGYVWIDQVAEKIRLQRRTVTHQSCGKIISLTLFIPNWICRFRADSFSTKEPETLEWIDESSDNGVFFDIGANIGLYYITPL